MKKALLITCAVLLVTTILFAFKFAQERADNKRLSLNQEALIKQNEIYLTEANENAISAYQVHLSYQELEDNYNDLVKKADDLNIKVKRLESISQAGSETDITLQAKLRDSFVVYQDTIYKYIDTLKVFTWSDQWVNCSGMIKDDSITANITSCDTITQIIHRVPKQWWFFKWGTKAIRQEMVSSNPHTKLTYLKYIELKK